MRWRSAVAAAAGGQAGNGAGGQGGQGGELTGGGVGRQVVVAVGLGITRSG
jgi:hypothetical protein